MNCPNCGGTIEPGQIKCFKCGSAVQQVIPQPSAQPQPVGSFAQTIPSTDEPKDWLTTLLMCFFVGYLGVHRFYTGSIAIGLIQFFTLGLCGIWTLIDFILILTGAYRDSYGRKLVRK